MDGYNGLATDRSADLEYWTNGRTTLVSSSKNFVSGSHSPDAVIAPAPSVQTITMAKRPLASSAPLPSSHIIRNSLIAGSVAGMASTAAMYPMDVSFKD